MPIGKREATPKDLQSNDPPEKRPENKPGIQWTLTEPRYRMSDIILDAATMSQLEDAVSYIQNKELLFSQWGLRERFSAREGLSINLYGPPGTGKTMAAHAMAAALSLPMLCVDYAEIESKYVGETSKNLSALFHRAREENAVIFFDEADALLSKRVTNMTSATDVSVNQTRSVLLNLFNDHPGVLLFATNFIRNFDPAFLRRIRYHIQFHLPNRALREQLWQFYLPPQLPQTLNVPEIAERFEGVSGSDIASAVFSAAVSAAKHREASVTTERFEGAIRSVLAVKAANAAEQVTVTTREISEEELRVRLGQEAKI